MSLGKGSAPKLRLTLNSELVFDQAQVELHSKTGPIRLKIGLSLINLEKGWRNKNSGFSQN